MNVRFEHQITDAGTEVRLVGPSGAYPADSWAVVAPRHLIPGVDLAERLVAAGGAITGDDVLLIDHATIAGLSAQEAAWLSLPPLAEVRAKVEGRGLIVRPDFAATLEWQRFTGQAIVNAQRVGAWLRIGEQWRRLPDSLFRIAEAIHRLNEVPGDDSAGRLAAIAALREILPTATSAGEAESRGILGSLTIVQADAFSLDWQGEGDAARPVPILRRAGQDGEGSVLPPEQQRLFGEDQFFRFGTARPVYTLGGGTFVILSPPLRKALAEVRRVASASLSTRKSLFASPRAFLRSALGEDVEATVLESVFHETTTWSERVVGLGLWQPRVLPWVAQKPTDWFGPEAAKAEGAESSPQRGLLIDDRFVALTPEQAGALEAEVNNAISAGKASVSFASDGETVDIPASRDTLAALQKLAAARTSTSHPPPARGALPEVLLIHPNESQVEIEGLAQVRPALSPDPPGCLRTQLKPHQAEGLAWLRRAWTTGSPGVLLADDMGLGKTLQGLSFLAWLREGMTRGDMPRAPILIVAPTGLLENWRAEHDRHLGAPGLGRCLQAYGRGLAALRKLDSDERPGINVDALRAAEWVLTTFETLRDYDRDFGRVRFAAILFDEAQKIKTPGVRLTDAAKAMNADFKIAMTGTPVENRLADLWCILDTVHPACLGDLKSFSIRYERAPDINALKRLKDSIDKSIGGRPPLLLRRLKEDRLPDLPARRDALLECAMPPQQAEAYDRVVAAARDAKRRGAVLEALQALRALCLHPGAENPESDDSYIAASARMRSMFQVLDRIAADGERALIFLDDLDVQARLVGIIQRRYGLAVPPMIINGTVTGPVRQARVDRFQAGADGFDVMLLSPRAGGVGLTLTRANHVIHLARWWNPAVEDQCTGRVLRIGQNRPVTVHIPISTLPDGRRSFDQNLHDLLERKRRLMREALMPPAATEEDREELLSATIAA